MASQNHKKSVLIPIIFFSWFRRALSLKELRRYIWRAELTETEVSDIIKELPVSRNDQNEVWQGELVGERAVQHKLAEELWRQVAKWRWLFSYIPFIVQVYVSNTLAYNNVHAGSDIDLFIIGRTGRLWTARLFLLVWLTLLRLRVCSVNRFAKFSPEFFVSDPAMDLRPLAIERDYYLSYWLADLVSIWPDGEHHKFRQMNNWVRIDLPIAWRSPQLMPYRYLHPTLGRRLIEKILSGKWGDKLETEAYYRQKKLIDKNLRRLGVHPSVVCNRDIIKLHFNDRRETVRNAVEATCNDLVGKTK